jgi:flagellar hook-associated protein 2
VGTASSATSGFTTSPGFTGISQYASDFQAELTKAAQIANIPITQLQTQDSVVISKETALGTISSDVDALANSVQTLGTLAAGQALGATSSNPSVVSVTNSGAPAATSYTINSITSVASAASEQSTAFYADASSTPVSSSGSLTLVAGGQTQTFQVTTNTLTGVRDQINALNAGVTASILTTPTGNYLSISANSTGATTLQLFDGASASGTDLLTSANQGTNAKFQINNLTVEQPGNVVNGVVPGVTFTILGQSNTPVTLTLASDPTQLSSALQDFVTKYNTVQSDVQAQTGAAGGPLAGDTILSQIRATLEHLTGYTTATGTVQSLADLGVELSDTGVASFNQTTFGALSATQVSDAFKFIGSATNGLGGFSASLSQYSDPVTGLVQSEVTGLKQTDQNLQDQIDTLTTRAAAAQTALTSQLEAADALQSELQQQQQELTASLQGLSLVLYGQNPNQLG